MPHQVRVVGGYPNQHRLVLRLSNDLQYDDPYIFHDSVILQGLLQEVQK